MRRVEYTVRFADGSSVVTTNYFEAVAAKEKGGSYSMGFRDLRQWAPFAENVKHKKSARWLAEHGQA